MSRERVKLDVSRTSAASQDGKNYWGFANFPNQVFRRAIKNGFDFTLMVVGRSGLGKSTFINTLFLAEINDLNEVPPAKPTESTVRIEEKHVKLIENSVTLNLNLVDTPGFGDAINNTKCWEPIVNYVDSKFLEFFCEETKIERKDRPNDRCVHLCLYFIEPTGHGLKQLDIEFMKQLHGRVNIVPVIAKADCLTKDELKRFKAQINKDIETNDIKLYKFPELEDETDKNAVQKLRNSLPFAIVGSNMLKDDNGKKLRYREYPWGIVEVENLAHNDFLQLRDMIVRINLIDMVDVTRQVHYENFRFRQMEKAPKQANDRDPFTYMEEERRVREKELVEKKIQLEKIFDDKVHEREAKIKERTVKMEQREQDLRKEMELRRTELEQLRQEIEELKKGNISDSKTSLMQQQQNENSSGKSSSPTTEKLKKKTGTLGLFNRN